MSRLVEPVFPSPQSEGGAEIRPYDRDMAQVLDSFAQNLLAILDGGISLADNIDAAVVSFTSNATPNIEDAVAHNLDKIPTHFLVSSLDKGAVVYKSATAFTDTHIYVKTTVASTAVKLILL